MTTILFKLLFPDEGVGSIHKDYLLSVMEEMADPTFADGTLVCQGVQIPCRRARLASRSEVFKKMFAQKGFVEG